MRVATWQVRLGAVLLAGLIALLSACSADKPKPTPLDSITPKIAGRQVWTAKLDSVNFPLGVAVRDDQFIVAGTDGTVLALSAQDGRELWRGQAGDQLAAGVGSDGRFAAVVTRGNQLVLIERGARRWSVALSSRTVTPPLVAGERVFIVGVDRAVHAFDALDGRRLWTHTRPGEALTLAQPGVLIAYKDTLVTGQGAVLVGLDPTRGTVRWEVAVATPRGTNEVERLSDLIGPALRVGDSLCVRSFQAAVGCVALDNGTLRWSRPVAGARAIGGDGQIVVGADSSDRIRAWKAATGDLAWTQERLLHRALTAPLSSGSTLVLGDLEGQVHFLARDSGETLLRLPTDGTPVVAAPVLAGITVLVVTRVGGLYAFRPQ